MNSAGSNFDESFIYLFVYTSFYCSRELVCFCFNLCVIVLGLMLRLEFGFRLGLSFFGVGNFVRVLAHA